MQVTQGLRSLREDCTPRHHQEIGHTSSITYLWAQLQKESEGYADEEQLLTLTTTYCLTALDFK